jgi:hypothetical protein
MVGAKNIASSSGWAVTSNTLDFAVSLLGNDVLGSKGAYKAPSKNESTQMMTVPAEGIEMAARATLIQIITTLSALNVHESQAQMAVDGIGTRSSPILINDSEEESIQELSYHQFYGSSSTGNRDTTPSTHFSTCLSQFIVF